MKSRHYEGRSHETSYLGLSGVRVLQIITTLNTGGAETMLRNVVGQFDRSKVETLVISLTTKTPIGDELEAVGIPVVALGGRDGFLTPRQLMGLFGAAAAWKPDVIHAWMYHANLAAHGLTLIARRPRPALITSVRGALNAPDRQKRTLRLVRRLDALLSRRADAIVFNSATSAKQHLAIGYDPRNIEVIPNGFDTVKFAPSEARRTEIREALGCGSDPLVGVVGRFDPLKGHRVFLEAAKRVAADYLRCKFVLVGRGCDRSNELLLSWIRELALGERVILLGERRDVPSIDCALDVVISSSLSESFPNAIGEAMACEVPAVVTDVGDCAALVADTGIIVPARDAGALAAGILDLLNRSALTRSALGKRARERIIARYALPAVAERFVAVYEASLARHARN